MLQNGPGDNPARNDSSLEAFVAPLSVLTMVVHGVLGVVAGIVEGGVADDVGDATSSSSSSASSC